ncbi:glycerophosphodiester phosphodiesterase [Saccharibacillus sp. O23]|uniref:glycerophosphodiester phosphodiesterase n=1 Tax=Saccharibacillus sp. O23 TaxID=2009338 RepID=UPI000B4E7A10|nr:glycerophosphodiester phosphodiesterase [Saccharibacillus sp. O23]OWR29802.1 glycerophosphodiester phosphodiesterase [Saccharibacillus sp. O23]
MPLKSFPKITAHTGSMGHPDHSLESLCAALKLGADIYEDDIRVTSDGVPVLAHDDEVRMKNGQPASLAELTLEEWKENSAAPALELADVLNWIRTSGRMMNLDIKSDDALLPAAKLVRQMGMEDRVILSGCEYERAKLAGRLGIGLRKLLNVDTERLKMLNDEQAIHEMTGQLCLEARSAGCFGLNLPYPVVRPELLAAAKREELAVYVWTVNESEEMRKLARWGVDGITTRDPAALIAVRGEQEFTEANEDWRTGRTTN